MELDIKKKFITFPYPYMNGILHLGHAYTLLSADIQARYYKMKGYEVLFPFGFHGSGMPIVACANKLKYELEEYKNVPIEDIPSDKQIRILMDMEIKNEELQNFIDPEYWVKYFSENAMKDLKDFGVYVDFDRSFYTTKMNPYYDSFITWQFHHLMNDGYVTKGKRYVVYSIKDDQPCADHDRRIGEGVKPIQLKTKLVNTKQGKLLCTVHNDNNQISKIYMNIKDNFVTLKINNDEIICNKNCYFNLIYQMNEINKNYPYEDFINVITKNIVEEQDVDIEYINIDKDFGTGFYIAENTEDIKLETCKFQENSNSDYVYYEPDGNVMSRTGDKCIVALTEQWFINYANTELKKNVCDYVENLMKNNNQMLQNSLINSVKELHEWPCSRNFGLGTFIPGTTDLIDSLSDSTIYMAYYTISHLIKKIPMENINNDLFDYVFLGKDYEIPDEYKDIISEMRREFLFWYPMDIRISGKDLIPNHLSMSLYNHYAIWKNNDCMPRTYVVNGYLMIKKKGSSKPVKMSKSEGTFITMRQGIREYGVNAVRYVLAYNYRYDDGVFDELFAETIKNKFGEKDWMDAHFYNLLDKAKRDESSDFNIWDNVFNEDIYYILSKIDEYYENTKYKEIIDLFDMLINSKNDYLRFQTDLHKGVIKKYINCALCLLYPIVPDLVEKIMKNVGLNNFEFKKVEKVIFREYGYYRDIINDTCVQIRKATKKGKDKSISVHIIEDFTSTENNIIKNPNIIDNETGETYGKYKGFNKFIEMRKEKYGNYMFNSKKEFDLVKQYVPIILKNEFHININIDFVKSNYENQFKFGPGKPKIITQN
jgi:leucyl-tRNA synthetase